jgi:hypothetical protein
MASSAIVTVQKMMEQLPETTQNELVEHLREYLADRQDERQWDTLYESTQPQLATAARRAKQEIAAGHAAPLDPDQL